MGTEKVQADKVRQEVIERFGEEMANDLDDIERIERELYGAADSDDLPAPWEEPITEKDIQQLIETMKEYGIDLTPEEAEELMRREPTDDDIEEGENA